MPNPDALMTELETHLLGYGDDIAACLERLESLPLKSLSNTQRERAHALKLRLLEMADFFARDRELLEEPSCR